MKKQPPPPLSPPLIPSLCLQWKKHPKYIGYQSDCPRLSWFQTGPTNLLTGRTLFWGGLIETERSWMLAAGRMEKYRSLFAPFLEEKKARPLLFFFSLCVQMQWGAWFFGPFCRFFAAADVAPLAAADAAGFVSFLGVTDWGRESFFGGESGGEGKEEKERWESYCMHVCFIAPGTDGMKLLGKMF